MSELEKLIPLLNSLNDSAFSAFVLWWVGEYVIPSAWGVFGVAVIWRAVKFCIAAYLDAEKTEQEKKVTKP